MLDYFGFNFPFFSEDDVLPPQSGVRLIKNDVKQLLMTLTKERVMRSDFGTSIRRTPFELGDELTYDELRSQIRDALKRFEPRVILREVKFIPKPDTNYLEIVVFMALSNDPNIVLDVSITTSPGDPSQPQQVI